MDSETKMNVANALIWVSVITCALAIASIIGMLCISADSPKEIQTDIQIDVLSILVTVLIGWNIYQLIDIKGIKKYVDDKINEVDNKMEQKFQAERELNDLVKLYNHGCEIMDAHPENAFRIFVYVANGYQQLGKETSIIYSINFAHNIAFDVIYGDEEAKKSYIDAVNKLKNERRKQFYEMARKFMDKYMKKPIVPNSLCDNEDLKELSKFIDDKYKC